MIYAFLLALCFCSGCGSFVHGFVASAQSGGYRLNSVAPCILAPEAVQVADLALVLYAQEATRRGLCTYAQAAAAARQLVACVLPAPERCCAGSESSCVRDTDGQVREKAGCAVGLWSWSSAQWPAGAARDWAPDLVHEIGHSFAETIGVATDVKHSTVWHAEVEPLVLRRFEAARTTP